jgi:CheY-like chemotaxis protein
MAITVLVTDDNPDALDATAAQLEHAGYSVIRANDVRQALDLLDERDEVDIVVSDIRMPATDGFDLARVLRHRFPALPIVLVTGQAVTREDVLPRGVVILQKPFTFDDLNRVLTEELQRTRKEPR